MNQPDDSRQQILYEREYEALVAECHCLVAAIANRPGAIKLLKGVIPVLEIYADYKANRVRSH